MDHGVTIGGIAGDSPASAAPSSRLGDGLPLLRRRTGFVSPSAVADAAVSAPPAPPHPPEFIVDSISASEGAGLAFLMESLSPRTVDGRIRRAVGMSRRERRGQDRGKENRRDESRTEEGGAVDGERRQLSEVLLRVARKSKSPTERALVFSTGHALEDILAEVLCDLQCALYARRPVFRGGRRVGCRCQEGAVQFACGCRARSCQPR